METRKLNEEQLYTLIREGVEEALMNEGFLDNLKAAWDGAKSGFSAQQSLDKDTSDLKRHWDKEDVFRSPFQGKAENTAEMEARELYAKYKKYQAMANKLLSKYNRVVKQYGLVKSEVPGMVSEPTKNPNFHGVPSLQRKSAMALKGNQQYANPSLRGN